MQLCCPKVPAVFQLRGLQRAVVNGGYRPGDSISGASTSGFFSLTGLALGGIVALMSASSVDLARASSSAMLCSLTTRAQEVRVCKPREWPQKAEPEKPSHPSVDCCRILEGRK